MSILANSTFTYFNLAGKGDATRLALLHGGIPYTDNRVTFPDWAALKPSTPFGQLPIIQVISRRGSYSCRAGSRVVHNRLRFPDQQALKPTTSCHSSQKLGI